MTAGVPAPLRWPRPHSPWPRVTGRSWGRPGDHRGAPGPDCEALMLTGLYRDGDQGSPLCTGRGPRAVWGHWSLPGTSCPPGWSHRPVLGPAPRPGTVPGLSRDVPGLSRDVPGCPRLSRAVPGLSQDVPGCPGLSRDRPRSPPTSSGCAPQAPPLPPFPRSDWSAHGEGAETFPAAPPLRPRSRPLEAPQRGDLRRPLAAGAP